MTSQQNQNLGTIEKLILYAILNDEDQRKFIKSPIEFASLKKVRLRSSERTILSSATELQLRAIIENYGLQIEDKKRRAFIKALSLGTLSASFLSLSSCEGRAIGEGPDIKILSSTMNSRVIFKDFYSSSLEFANASGAIDTLSIHVSLTTVKATHVKILIISPTGMEFILEEKNSIRSINKWYGYNGELTKESLSLLKHENATGDWIIEIRINGEGVIRQWGLEAKVTPDTEYIGTNVSYIYGTRPPDSGCSCE